jgi:hypothetical protein
LSDAVRVKVAALLVYPASVKVPNPVISKFPAGSGLSEIIVGFEVRVKVTSGGPVIAKSSVPLPVLKVRFCNTAESPKSVGVVTNVPDAAFTVPESGEKLMPVEVMLTAPPTLASMPTPPCTGIA